MSSFNISGPNNQPIIQSAQNLGKDGGGGGNTGFMNMRGKKKDEKKENEEDNSVFLEEEIEDTFTKEKKPEENEKKGNRFLNAISNFLNEKEPKEKDSFVKSENPYANDLENEIADDDDYYNNVDV